MHPHLSLGSGLWAAVGKMSSPRRRSKNVHGSKPGSVYSARLDYGLHATTFSLEDIPEHALAAKREVKAMIHKDILERLKPKWNISTHTPTPPVLSHQILRYNSLAQPYNFRAEALPPKVPLQFPLHYDKFHFDERKLYSAPPSASPPPPSHVDVDIFLGDYDPSGAPSDSDSDRGPEERPDESSLGTRRALGGGGRSRRRGSRRKGGGGKSRGLESTVHMAPGEVLATRVVNTRVEIPSAALPEDAPRWDSTTSPSKKIAQAKAKDEWDAIAAQRAASRAGLRSSRAPGRQSLVARTTRFNHRMASSRARRARSPRSPPTRRPRASRPSPRRPLRNKVPRQREYFHTGILQPSTSQDEDEELMWSCCASGRSVPGCEFRFKPDNRGLQTYIPRPEHL